MSPNTVQPQAAVTVAEALFGRGGLLVLFMMYTFIIMNICVFQLFAFSSILTFNIYGIHVRANSVTLMIGINALVSATLGSLLYSFLWEGMTATGVVIGTALSTSMAGLVWVLMSTLVRLYPNLSIGKAAFGLICSKS
ncbi:hypothetical protein EGR_06593 [Echinococcus granulosus]|uniref:Uncharacterized protein n=1 Tax=Echinococcus granulosus TaxID=6210 RepID=W6UCW5_ECHGR|nr:hypothetical protein EGR_06593 [Echinococcus granulosus]EUB58606.1 hypothetical protein EGR_06593 [Echinococcus granulosus]